MSMLDRAGWTLVGCEEADTIHEGAVYPVSSLTDLSGQFGTPVIFTEWAHDRDADEGVLRDYLWHPHEVMARCEHLVRDHG